MHASPLPPATRRGAGAGGAFAQVAAAASPAWSSSALNVFLPLQRRPAGLPAASRCSSSGVTSSPRPRTPRRRRRTHRPRRARAATAQRERARPVPSRGQGRRRPAPTRQLHHALLHHLAHVLFVASEATKASRARLCSSASSRALPWPIPRPDSPPPRWRRCRSASPQQAWRQTPTPPASGGDCPVGANLSTPALVYPLDVLRGGGRRHEEERPRAASSPSSYLLVMQRDPPTAAVATPRPARQLRVVGRIRRRHGRQGPGVPPPSLLLLLAGRRRRQCDADMPTMPMRHHPTTTDDADAADDAPASGRGPPSSVYSPSAAPSPICPARAATTSPPPTPKMRSARATVGCRQRGQRAARRRHLRAVSCAGARWRQAIRPRRF